MTRIDDEMGKPASFEAGRTLWQRCCIAETAESESERFLDLAALADGMLDDDEHDRIAALVASDPVAMADVAAARALSTGGIAMPGGFEPIIERAIAIVAPAPERSRKIAAIAGAEATAISSMGWRNGAVSPRRSHLPAGLALRWAAAFRRR